MNLGDSIVKYRAKYDLTQEQFGQRCGLTKMTINYIERGRENITKLTRAKIERVLEGDEIGD